MDRRIIFALALLLILPSASALDAFGCLSCPMCCIGNITAQVNQVLDEYSSTNVVGLVAYAIDGQTIQLDLRSTVDLSSPSVQMFIISSSAPNFRTRPDSGDSITIACLNSNITYYLDSQIIWNSNGFANIQVPLNTGYSAGAFYSTEEAAATKYSNLCYVTMRGNDAMIEVHYRPVRENALTIAFKIPDDATNEIIQRTEHTLSAGFDIIRLVIIAAGLVLLIFIIVFMAKVFMFFIKKLKVRGR